jgi:hypothetical protein
MKMENLDIDSKAAELGRIDNKSTGFVQAVGGYSIFLAVFFAVIFIGAVWSINNARTNGGVAVAWFVAILSGLFLIGTAWSIIEIVVELIRRRKSRE